MENSITILHLDDSQDWAFIFELLITDAFKNKPINWYYAKRNEDAINLLQNLKTVHILITDIKRFHETNKELHEYLLHNSIYPIKILYSSHYDSYIIEENKLLNYAEYLHKSFKLTKPNPLFTHIFELVAIIKEIAEQQNKSFYEIYSLAPPEIVYKGISELIIYFQKHRT